MTLLWTGFDRMEATELTVTDVVADLCYHEINTTSDLSTFLCCLSYLNNNEHQS